MNPWKVDGEELAFSCGCRFPITKKFDDPEKMPCIKFNTRKVVFCEATKNLFASGKTKGVFQLEKQLGQTWARRLKPETKAQVSGLVAVLRPGTLRAKDENGISMTQHYINRKNKTEVIPPYHPVVDNVLKDSFNVLIYQEQSMKLAVECAKFTPTEADSLRRCVTGDTRFLTSVAGWMTIESLLHNDEYKNHTFLVIKDGRSIYKKIEKIWLTGERPVKRVTIDNGMGVKATKNHQFLTTKGWKRRDELEVNDKLIIPKIRNFINGEYTICGHKGLSGDDVEFVVRRSREDNSESRIIQFNNDIFKNNNGMNPVILRIFSIKEAVRIERANLRFSSNSLELLRGAQLMLSQVGIDCLVEDFSNSLLINDIGSLHLLNENLKLHRIPNNIDGGICGLIKGRPIKGCSKDTASILDIHGGNERVKVYDFTMADGDVPHIVANGLIIHNSIGKKDAKEMAKNKLLFIDKAKEAKIISEEQAAELFDWIEKSNRYSFNRAHSWSYGLKAIKTAYLKAHFPLYFFANWLKFAHTKQDAEGEANELVEDAKSFDVRVVCPDIRHRNTRVKLGNKKIIFGMADVGGVGETFVEILLIAVEKAEAKLGKPISTFTWTELLLEVLYDKNSKAIDGLICAGAFSWTGVTRQRQRNEYLALHKFKTKKTLIKWLVENRQSGESLVDLLKKAAKLKKEGGGCSNQAAILEVEDEISLLEHPPTPEDDNPRVIADFETKLLGVAVSCSMLDGCDTSGANATCADFSEKSVNRGFVAAIITSAHKHTTKTDKDMAFLTITDQSGTLQNIVVFSDLFEEHKSILREGNALLLQLEAGRDDGFIVKTIAQI